MLAIGIHLRPFLRLVARKLWSGALMGDIATLDER